MKCVTVYELSTFFPIDGLMTYNKRVTNKDQPYANKR